MNNIVNLSQLITRLAKVTATDPNTARLFLRGFFATIEDALADGETVEIKGIGTFRRCDDPAVGTPGTVGFAPDEEFAAEINRPFAVFEAVELADGLTEEDLEPAPEEIPAPEEMPAVATAPAETPAAESAVEKPAAVEEPAVVDPAVETPIEETVPEEPALEEEPAEKVPVEAEPKVEAPVEEEHKAPWEIYGKGPFFEEEKKPETIVETGEKPVTETAFAKTEPAEEPEADADEPADEPEEESGRSGNRMWIWIAAAGIVLFGVVGYLAAVLATPIPSYGDDDYEPEAVATDTATLSETVAEPAVGAEPEPTPAPAQAVEPTPAPQPAPAAKEPRYDTVTSKRYLAIMAREYYGKSIYWVFIYEANADKLADPNKVSPGTRVLIPDKESLPGSTDAERLSIAEKKQAQILGRYK